MGSEQVMKALTSLPPTRHDIGGPAEKFCLDSFPVPHGQSMGLLLTVHGQFTEGMCYLYRIVTFRLRCFASRYGRNKVIRSNFDAGTGTRQFSVCSLCIYSYLT